MVCNDGLFCSVMCFCKNLGPISIKRIKMIYLYLLDLFVILVRSLDHHSTLYRWAKPPHSPRGLFGRDWPTSTARKWRKLGNSIHSYQPIIQPTRNMLFLPQSKATRVKWLVTWMLVLLTTLVLRCQKKMAHAVAHFFQDLQNSPMGVGAPIGFDVDYGHLLSSNIYYHLLSSIDYLLFRLNSLGGIGGSVFSPIQLWDVCELPGDPKGDGWSVRLWEIPNLCCNWCLPQWRKAKNVFWQNESLKIRSIVL